MSARKKKAHRREEGHRDEDRRRCYGKELNREEARGVTGGKKDSEEESQEGIEE